MDTGKMISTHRNGHIVCEAGAIIHNRYRVVKQLGRGFYGCVMEVFDTKTNTSVALKVSNNKMICRSAAKKEIRMLKFIERADRMGTSLCERMFDSFPWNGHICITYELLGCDLFHFMKANNFTPFPLADIRHIAYQLCYAVEFLHCRGVIHTDLKTDNILFVDSSYTEEYDLVTNASIRTVNRSDIRLIDFGCAVDDDEPQCHTINNRCYRPPEVVLNANWSHPVDVWSIGCILYELYTGNLLFNTEENDLEHLGIMERILGPLPLTMTDNHEYFTNGKVNFDWNARPLEMHCHQPLRKSNKTKTEDDDLFFDLMEKMLVYEPTQRIKLVDALRHPFFDKIPSYHRL